MKSVDPLFELLQQCCVRVRGKLAGSGFFVLPGLVLSCAHVVGKDHAVGSEEVEVQWRDQVETKATILGILPGDDDDLALLRVGFKDHPWVRLGPEVALGDPVVAYGFPDHGTGQQGDTLTGQDEGPTHMPDANSERALRKFKDANVIGGFSGSPLLNRRTGSVIGVVSDSRGSRTAFGGWAVPADFALQFLDTILGGAGVTTVANPTWDQAWRQEIRARSSRAQEQRVDPPKPILILGSRSTGMDYQYDVFISYRRYGEWTGWVRDRLIPLLKGHLANELGRPPTVFLEVNEVAAGADWSYKLAPGLTTSRVLIPLLSRMYFTSEWCLREYYAMRFKESQLGLDTPQSPGGLIVPARIHDGTRGDLPAHLHEICRPDCKDLTDFAITSIYPGGQLFERFEISLRDWVQSSVAPAIRRAQALDPEWLEVIANREFPCPDPFDPDDSGRPSLA